MFNVLSLALFAEIGDVAVRIDRFAFTIVAHLAFTAFIYFNLPLSLLLLTLIETDL